MESKPQTPPEVIESLKNPRLTTDEQCELVGRHALAIVRDAAALPGVIAERDAGDLLLRLLLNGLATFDPSTSEFRFNGLRYSCRDGKWDTLLAVIGPGKAKAALAILEGRE